VTETLRAALNEIAKIAPKWLYLRITDGWLDDYSRRIEEYRLPKGEQKRNEYGSLVGSRSLRLLTLIEAEDTPTEIKSLNMVKALRQMWEHQFEIRDGKVQFRPAGELPPVGERFDSPYDIEARYGNKRATTWRGYKVHFTETCDEDCPFLISNVETTTANVPDIVMGQKIHQSLQTKDLLPDTHLLDAGYVEAKWIVQSAKEKNVQIVGPPRPNNQWQSLAQNGFALSDFQIDWDNKEVTCPKGQTTTNWYPYLRQGVEHIRVRFKRSQCNGCEKRNFCTRSVREARSLGFANKENYLKLEEFRKIQDNPAWQKLYNQRAGIEGTFSQAVRSFDLRRSRYIGEKKTHLHNLATAAAINIGRSVNWLEEKPREKTRVSWFAKLKHLEL
jgi:transposase